MGEAYSCTVKNNKQIEYMGLFGWLSGNDDEAVKEMLSNGAVVIDVRSPEEFKGGHVKGSKNYPLQRIEGKVDELKKIGKPLVLCCASGGRSGRATQFLKSKGITCANGGGWRQVDALKK